MDFYAPCLVGVERQPNVSGQSIKVGNQRLITDDCISALDRDPTIANIDVIVTSPPYNLNLDYLSYNDDLPEEKYLSWLEEVCIKLAGRLAEDGSFFLNVSGSGSRPWLPFMLASRLRNHLVLQNHICWIKSVSIDLDTAGHFKPISGNRYLHQNHEHIFHFTLRGTVKLDRLSIGLPFKDKTNIARRSHARDLKCRGNTWYIPYKTIQKKTEKYNHPGTFPITLPLWCIYLHGKANPLVLDPFVGVGTTLMASQMAGGYGIGIDSDSTYIEAARSRLVQDAEESMHVQLNEAEITELLRQKPETAGNGGFQGLLVSLQNKLNKSTGSLSLSTDDLRRIPNYAFTRTGGGWETRLKAIFERHLGPSLDGVV